MARRQEEGSVVLLFSSFCLFRGGVIVPGWRSGVEVLAWACVYSSLVCGLVSLVVVRWSFWVVGQREWYVTSLLAHRVGGSTRVPCGSKADDLMWFNSTAEWLLDVYGTAGLGRDEAEESHCTDAELRVFAFDLDLHQDERRATECNFNQQTSEACRGGFYYSWSSLENASLVESVEEVRVRPAPAGYFSPEFFTCLIRCPEGALCPQASLGGDWTCRYPESVDRNTELLGASCPGSRFSYTCPPGHACPRSEGSAEDCRRGHYCPPGSTKPLRCESLLFRASTLCPTTKLAHVDYSKPLRALLLAFGATGLAALLVSKRILLLPLVLPTTRWWWSSPRVAPCPPRSSRSEHHHHQSQRVACCGMEMRFERLSLRLRKTGAIVLSQVSGRVSPHEVTAIMGPSGSGKTSLLNVLADRAHAYGDATGSRFVDGREITSLGMLPRGAVGFVPQDDASLLPELTVRQTLAFYACIKESSSSSSSQQPRERRRAAVDDALRLVALDDKALLDVRVGDAAARGISGGQKKRLSLAIEIVMRRPSILLCDEATSSLDSATSAHVIAALHALARQDGCTVVLTLHNPAAAVFTSFHKLVLLGVGGLVVFAGSPADAVSYFSAVSPASRAVLFEVNPADAILDVILSGPDDDDDDAAAHDDDGRRASRALCIRWQQSTKGTQDALAREGSATKTMPQQRSLGLARQAWLFAHRAVLQEVQRADRLLADVGIALALGAAVGFHNADLELQDMAETNLWLSIALQLMVTISSLRVFGSERLVFRREHAVGSGLSVAARFVGKDVAHVPRLGLVAIGFALPYYLALSPASGLAIYVATIFLAAYAAAGLAHVFAALADARASHLLCVVSTVVLTALSGTAATRLAEIHDAGSLAVLLSWLGPPRWAAESLFVANTRRLGPASRLPPQFYLRPTRESVLAYLLRLGYHEAWLDDLDTRGRRRRRTHTESPGDDGDDDRLCDLRLDWINNETLNFPMLLGLGLAFRLLAFHLLLHCDRGHLGKPPLLALLTRRATSRRP